MPRKDPKAYNEYMREYMRNQYERNVEWIRQYKIDKGCLDCGYNTHHAGLQFDHRDGRPTKDEKSISKLLNNTRKRVLVEIEKCDVVCATCHAIRTWNRSHPEDT